MKTSLTIRHKLKKIFFLIFLSILITGCSGNFFKKVDTRKVPVNVTDRQEKNIQEGRGFRLMNAVQNKNNSGTFEFATANEMWRASLDLLDFAPLSNVDYSGGIIITDWFSQNNSNDESIKITIRFLSNEIRADGLDVIIYKKLCKNDINCETKKIESTLSQEIKLAILKKAAELKTNETVIDKNYKIRRSDSDKKKNQ